MKNFQKLLVNFFRQWWFGWLLAGILLRLFLSAVTVHPHVYDLSFSGYLFAFKHVGNIYDYLFNLPSTNVWSHLYGSSFFTYPPLAYFTLGGFTFLASPFFNLPFYEQFITHPLSFSLGNPALFQHLLVFKSFFLFFDLGIAFLLMNLFREQEKKKKVFLLWLFNPVTLYANFMTGQFEVIPLFFCVLALILAFRGRSRWAAISLGVGAAYKMFPLFFLPFLVLLAGKNLREKISLAILGVLPYFLTILPFLFSKAFRVVSLFSAQSQKMLHMSLPVSGDEGIYVFVFLFVFLVFWAGYRKIKIESLWWYFLAVMLLFFSVTHYHPQWFLWLTPFLIFELVYHNFRRLFLVSTMFICWMTLTLFFEPSLSYGAFSPIWPQLASSQGLSETFSRYIDVFMIKSTIRSVFAGASIFLIWQIFSEKEKKPFSL